MASSIVRVRAAVAAVGCRQFASSAVCLMLPSNKLYSLGGKKVVNINSSPIDKESESDHVVVGSSHGWVGLFNVWSSSSRSASVSVWNPTSGDHIELPPIHTIPNPYEYGELRVKKLIVDDAECSRVVIVGSSMWRAVCCPGRCSEWTPLERTRETDDVVACSPRKFYNLRGGNELVRWNISEPRRPRIEWKSSLSELGYHAIHRDDEIEGSLPHLVYAEHSDQLFIVTRRYVEQKIPDDDVEDLWACEMYPYTTVAFDVHIVEVEGSCRGKVRYMKRSLDGLVMFVGLNNSFALPAADFPHLKPDSIYFTNHHAHVQPRRRYRECTYGRHDVGIYDYKNQMLSSCYYPSDHHCFEGVHPHPFWFTPTSTT